MVFSSGIFGGIFLAYSQADSTGLLSTADIYFGLYILAFIA
jgi:hypothetical protein